MRNQDKFFAIMIKEWRVNIWGENSIMYLKQ